ncbi:MAG: hypothetical protein GC136_01490 [Alphaproteobacteria bacterium]|nr:hypothetical protein [Alphaproteobacteria bacterium]
MKPKTMKQKTQQNRKYSATAEKMSLANKVVSNAAKKALEDLKVRNPDFEGLNFSAGVMMVRPQGQKGVTKAYMALAELIANVGDRKFPNRNQTEMLKEIQSKYSDLKLYPAVWNKKLSGGLKQKIKQRIEANLTTPVSLANCNTLAEMRRKVLSTRATAAPSSHKFKPSIIFTGESVTIGRKVYPLEMRGSGKYPCIRVEHRGRRQWLRMDVLVTLLKAV